MYVQAKTPRVLLLASCTAACVHVVTRGKYLMRVNLTAPVVVLYLSSLATSWNTRGRTALSILITMADKYSPMRGISTPL